MNAAGEPNGAALLADGLRTVCTHEQAALRTLTMIPAENLMPPVARIPLCGDLYARYMFDEDPDRDAGEWRFPAAKDAAELENRLAVPLLRHLGRAKHVNLRPLSGLHAMELVLAALGGRPGDRVVVVAASNGGHYATTRVAQRVGLRPVQVAGPDPHRLSMDTLARICACEQPSLVYIDQCHGLIPFNIKAIVRTVRCHAPNALVHVDGSHWLGLMFGGAVANPLEQGADSFGGSTHKSFPGPQKGVVLTNTADIAARLRARQPEVISSHHFGAVAALALALAAFVDHADDYAAAVVDNSRTLGKRLAAGGLDVVGEEFGYSAGHQLWIRTEPRMPARRAAEQLYQAGIRVNWLTDLPLPEPALRLGLAEATWLGLQPSDMPELAEVITTALATPARACDLADRTAALRARATYPFVPVLDQATMDLAENALTAGFGPRVPWRRSEIDPR
jgi:glycine/serine hydroxymethyltransferase